MNRTIEQWSGIAEHADNSLLIEAISDLQELARQLETERAAWSARRAELLRNHDAELARRKAAEVQRDELLGALELCRYDSLNMSIADMEKVREIYQRIKEQTK